jgi:hypothetical protein
MNTLKKTGNRSLRLTPHQKVNIVLVAVAIAMGLTTLVLETGILEL